MALYRYRFWKKIPFLKILIPLIAGIVAQWNFQLPANMGWWIMIIAVLFLCSIFFIPLLNRFHYSALSGITVSVIFFSVGILLALKNDIRNNSKWLGHYYKESQVLIATLDEPLVEKTKSFKANATVTYLMEGEKSTSVTGKIIIYFKKDSLRHNLRYGSQILLKKNLQEIKNSGNPGSFDYKRYSLFQGITHQVYLKPGDFEILQGENQTWLKKLIYSSREKVLTLLRKNIRGEKELGLAEALLIGYKNDLDQSLVQSYTNTGVVHIIAISGLHLGLIYWLLVQLFKPLRRNKKTNWLAPVLIITGLWAFSLLAGAQPSVLRSALMFSCIVLGESFSRKSSVYNTMAISAFILLCYNPYWLWDVGFQLSYAAVLSIIIFMRPIYNWFYIKNKILDFIWKLNAVTMAAQVLTIPLGIYHFHQFPSSFILTNFLAVPLSSMILIGEILLCIVSFIPSIALFIGKIISWFIWLMNTYVERIEMIPFSLWDGLQISLTQAIFLIFFASGIGYWLMEKSKYGLKMGMAGLFLFLAERSISFIKAEKQQKIIVYNVPQKRAIDFIDGRNYRFVGDSDLLMDGFTRNFHLKPSRILYRIKSTDSLGNFLLTENYISFQGKKVLLLEKAVSFLPNTDNPVVDLLILSGNPKLYMKKLAGSLEIKQVIFDASVPAWKTNYWKRDCDSLHIPWHDVTTKGAFVMKVN
ncbi:MAG: ComEC family competence protein [Chitinophagaceae bacterium]|nr:ComEC family competence protein [Chitinophagaceae bacterium]